jgi:hypothetical protein
LRVNFFKSESLEEDFKEEHATSIRAGLHVAYRREIALAASPI